MSWESVCGVYSQARERVDAGWTHLYASYQMRLVFNANLHEIRYYFPDDPVLASIAPAHPRTNMSDVMIHTREIKSAYQRYINQQVRRLIG